MAKTKATSVSKKKHASPVDHARYVMKNHGSVVRKALKSGKEAGQLLGEYILEHEKNVDSFSKKLGAGVASVYRWIAASGPRSQIIRVAIENQTGGCVPASLWPEARNRWTAAKEAEALMAQKLAEQEKKRAAKRRKAAADGRMKKVKLNSVTKITEYEAPKPAATPIIGDSPEAA